MPEWKPIQSPFEPLQRAVVARLHLHPATQALKVFDAEPSRGPLEPEAGETFLTVELATSSTDDTDDGTLYEATLRLYATHITRGPRPGSPRALLKTLREVEEALTSRPIEIAGFGEQELRHDGAQRLPVDGAKGRTRRRAVLDLAFSHYATR